MFQRSPRTPTEAMFAGTLAAKTRHGVAFADTLEQHAQGLTG